MTHAEYVAWAEQMDAAGKTDPMGCAWTTWLLAKRDAGGHICRDKHGRVIYITQDEWKATTATIATPPAAAQPQLELFA